jgi:hypothetical protein
MRKIRQRNDIDIVVHLKNDEGVVLDPTQNRDYEITVHTASKKVKITDFQLFNDGRIAFRFHAKDQARIGVYNITISATTTDGRIFTTDVCDAFILVACSCDAGNDSGEVEIITLDIEATFAITAWGWVDDDKLTAIEESLKNKVDKIEGKQLTEEDFTTELKKRLESLNNYDDTKITKAIEDIQRQVSALLDRDTSSAIDSFNEILAFLDGIEDTQTFTSIVASIERQIANKQSTIADLDTIRKGAQKGMTALQEEQYKGTVTGIKMNGQTKGLSGVVDLGTVLTEHQDISGKQDVLVSGENIKTINGESILGEGDIVIEGGGGVTEEYVNNAIAEAITTTLNTEV